MKVVEFYDGLCKIEPTPYIFFPNCLLELEISRKWYGIFFMKKNVKLDLVNQT